MHEPGLQQEVVLPGGDQAQGGALQVQDGSLPWRKPFSTFNDHIKVCKSLFPVNAKSMTSSFNQNLLDGDTINWKPAIFNINNEVFVVQRKQAEGKFIFAVSMLAGKEKCDRFMVTLFLW